MKKINNLLSLAYSVLGTISVYSLSFILANQSKYLFGEFSSFIFLLNIFISSAGVGIDIQTARLFVKGEMSKIGVFLFAGTIFNAFLTILYIIISIALNKLSYIYAFPIVVFQFFIIYIVGRLQVEKRFLEMSLIFNSVNIFRLVFLSIALYYYRTVTLNEIIISFLIIHLFFMLFIFFKYKNYFVFGKTRSIKNFLLMVDKNAFTSLSVVAIAPFLHMLIYQSDIIILSANFDPTTIASYSIVITILTAIYYFPSLIANRYILSRLLAIGYNEKKKENKSIYIYNSLCVLLIIFLFSISDFIFKTLFSGKYNDSIYIFQLLLIACIFRLFSIPIATTLNTEKLAPKKIVIMACVAFLNITFNIIYVPRYGIDFLIISTISTEILLFSSYLYLFNRK
ncbi:hypothetical protein [Providencia sp. JUb39]|uniref:hypothetical protein n=1 Tax=Providencia sp. JUb39 TaxID=2724165 RepID=UPI00164D1C2E|nr:hypothetical protein [Providencia sp. JUb39]